MKIKRGTKKKRNGQWDERIAIYISKDQRRKLKDVAKILHTTETAFARKVLADKLETYP